MTRSLDDEELQGVVKLLDEIDANGVVEVLCAAAYRARVEFGDTPLWKIKASRGSDEPLLLCAAHGEHLVKLLDGVQEVLRDTLRDRGILQPDRVVVKGGPGHG